MSNVRIVRDYPHPPQKVWRTLTDPALVALWAMRPWKRGPGASPGGGRSYKNALRSPNDASRLAA
jgi:uncharacterized protein YndB with AHSA1/START domain